MEAKIKIADVVVLIFAPPCGTSARSREIRRMVGPDPKPLRSDLEPDGLSYLSGTDKERVLAANELYRWVVKVIKTLKGSQVLWLVENPTNSLMWKTSFFVELMSFFGEEARWAHMQMCMHGGERDKKTSLLYGGPWSLESMCLMCDGSHKHKPWGLLRQGGQVFATAGERNYPELLCKRVAKQAGIAVGVTGTKEVLEREVG